MNKRIIKLMVLLIVCLAMTFPAAMMEEIEAPIEEQVIALEGDDAEAIVSEPEEAELAADAAQVPTYRLMVNCNKKVNVGDVFQLEHGNFKILSYSSSDNWALADCYNGLITAKKAGVTKITARFTNGRRAVLTLTIVDDSLPTRVSLDQPASLRLDVGKTLQLKAKLYPSTTQSDLIWKSSADGIASVDANGLVTPHNVGAATITVTTARGNKQDSVKLTITDSTVPTGISLNKSGTVKIDLSQTISLIATLKPASASSDILWKSSATGIATVSDGVVYPIRVGTAIITATTARGNYSDKVKVVISDKSMPTDITLNKSGTVKLDLYATLRLIPTIKPASAESDIIWSSNATGIATVRNGVVYPVKAGTATITATTVRGNKRASVKVNVLDMRAPTSIRIRGESKKTIHVGATRTMGYTVYGYKGYTIRKNLTWTSDYPSVLRVVDSKKGIFRAVSPGRARVTVTTDNGKKDSFLLRVVK